MKAKNAHITLAEWVRVFCQAPLARTDLFFIGAGIFSWPSASRFRNMRALMRQMLNET